MNKKRLMIISLVAVLLVAAVGTTLALMSAKTDEKENVFTVGQGIKGELKEPNWDGDNFTDADNQVTVVTDDQLGKKKAENYYPGSEMLKDPAVANRSAVDTWIAVTIDYSYFDRIASTDGQGNEVVTYATTKNPNVTGMIMFHNTPTKFAEIDFNNTDWEFNSDYTVAYYKTKVEPKKKTNTVFNKVTIDKLADVSDTVDLNKMLGISKFEIDLQGYLVQAQGVDTLEAAKTELDKIIEKHQTSTGD